MKQSRPPYRHDVHKAKELISNLLPDRKSLYLFAGLFAASCRQAHAQSPACWEVTLTPKYLRLNVGPVAVLDVLQNEIFLCTLPLRNGPPTGTRYYFSSSKPVYPSVPIRSASLRLPPHKLGRINATILKLHLEYVAEAAVHRSVSVWSDAHSPAAVDYLASVVGDSIPQPSYSSTEQSPLGSVTAVQGELKDIQKVLDSNAELDQARVVLARREQAVLRRYLFRGDDVGICALCGGNFPVSLLVAAHIKPRAKCSDEEKRDYKNNIIAMCLLGCDAFFERGLIIVEDGKIRARRLRRKVNERLDHFLRQIDGRPTSAWAAGRIKYFSWHAQHASNTDSFK